MTGRGVVHRSLRTVGRISRWRSSGIGRLRLRRRSSLMASGEPRRSPGRRWGRRPRCRGRDRHLGIVQSSAAPPGRQPAHRVTVVRRATPLTETPASTSTCSSTTDDVAHPSYFAHVATEASAPGYGAIDGRPDPRSTLPPSYRIVSSAVPWISSTATGAVGAQSVGFRKVAPARLTIAAIVSAWAQDSA